MRKARARSQRTRDIREVRFRRGPSRDGGLRRQAHGLRHGGRSPAERQRYFLFLRWIRVFFSSLRCFFFAIRLRRFLMTEPTGHHPLGITADGHAVTHRHTGGWAQARKSRHVNANRSRSPQAYPVRQGPDTRPSTTSVRLVPAAVAGAPTGVSHSGATDAAHPPSAPVENGTCGISSTCYCERFRSPALSSG
jgi:hypothetical protein